MGKGYCERVPGRKQLSRNAKTVTECKTLCENDRHRTCKFISYQFMKMNGRNYCYGYPKCHTQLNYRDDYESYSMGPIAGQFKKIKFLYQHPNYTFPTYQNSQYFTNHFRMNMTCRDDERTGRKSNSSFKIHNCKFRIPSKRQPQLPNPLSC